MEKQDFPLQIEKIYSILPQSGNDGNENKSFDEILDQNILNQDHPSEAAQCHQLLEKITILKSGIEKTYYVDLKVRANIEHDHDYCGETHSKGNNAILRKRQKKQQYGDNSPIIKSRKSEKTVNGNIQWFLNSIYIASEPEENNFSHNTNAEISDYTLNTQLNNYNHQNQNVLLPTHESVSNREFQNIYEGYGDHQAPHLPSVAPIVIEPLEEFGADENEIKTVNKKDGDILPSTDHEENCDDSESSTDTCDTEIYDPDSYEADYKENIKHVTENPRKDKESSTMALNDRNFGYAGVARNTAESVPNTCNEGTAVSGENRDKRISSFGKVARLKRNACNEGTAVSGENRDKRISSFGKVARLKRNACNKGTAVNGENRDKRISSLGKVVRLKSHAQKEFTNNRNGYSNRLLWEPSENTEPLTISAETISPKSEVSSPKVIVFKLMPVNAKKGHKPICVVREYNDNQEVKLIIHGSKSALNDKGTYEYNGECRIVDSSGEVVFQKFMKIVTLQQKFKVSSKDFGLDKKQNVADKTQNLINCKKNSPNQKDSSIYPTPSVKIKRFISDNLNIPLQQFATVFKCGHCQENFENRTLLREHVVKHLNKTENRTALTQIAEAQEMTHPSSTAQNNPLISYTRNLTPQQSHNKLENGNSSRRGSLEKYENNYQESADYYEAEELDICFKREKQLDDVLEAREITHPYGLTAHNCPICVGGFSCPRNIFYHFITIPVISTDKCAACIEGFEDTDCLEKHLTQHIRRNHFRSEPVFLERKNKAKDVPKPRKRAPNRKFSHIKKYKESRNGSYNVKIPSQKLKNAEKICPKGKVPKRSDNEAKKEKTVPLILKKRKESSLPLILKRPEKGTLPLAREELDEITEPLKIFKCGHCKENFESRTLLREHVLTHVNKTQIQTALTQIGVANDKKFLFFCCKRYFEDEESLKIHESTHRIRRSYDCLVVCQYTSDLQNGVVNAGMNVMDKKYTPNTIKSEKCEILEMS